MLIDTSTSSRTIDSTSRPTYPTSVNFDASTLRKGAPARRARRRAISVFPTPVGPIMMMLFGRISSRISSGAWCGASGCAPRWRRPSSRLPVPRCSGRAPPRSCAAAAPRARGAAPPVSARGAGPAVPGSGSVPPSQLQNADVGVRVDADLGGDLERALHDLLRRELGRAQQRAGGRQRVAAARPDREDAVVGLDQLTRAGEHVALLLVRDDEQRLEPPQ